MHLEMSEPQAIELKEVLDVFLQGMLQEIVRTEDRAFGEALRDKYDRIEQVRNRLAASIDGTQVFA